MASSGVRSVIGRPFRTGSCLGFFSAAVAAGLSIPSEENVLKARKHERNARGVKRTRARLRCELGLERWRGNSSITLRLTLRDGKSCWLQGQALLKDSGVWAADFSYRQGSRYCPGRSDSAHKQGAFGRVTVYQAPSCCRR